MLHHAINCRSLRKGKLHGEGSLDGRSISACLGWIGNLVIINRLTHHDYYLMRLTLIYFFCPYDYLWLVVQKLMITMFSFCLITSTVCFPANSEEECNRNHFMMMLKILEMAPLHIPADERPLFAYGVQD